MLLLASLPGLACRMARSARKSVLASNPLAVGSFLSEQGRARRKE